MKKTVCRKCFASFLPRDAAYGCQNDNCAHNGVSLSPTPDGRPPVCGGCDSDLSIYPRLCPECGFPLPEEKGKAEHLGISIAGAEGCGKSHYLSVLIDQIKNEMARPYGCSLYPLGGDRTQMHYDDHYYNPLFVRGECIPSTIQEVVDPLVYSLIFENGRGREKACSVTFYDACGANFQREAIMQVHNRSICNARGLLFLIDPSQLPGLRDDYQKNGRPVCEEDAYSLLTRMVHLIRSSGRRRGKIDIPLAVCITKTDTLRQHLDPSSFLRGPSRHLREGTFASWDYESCSLEVQSLIESWAGRELLNQISSQFSTFGYFGFSALGAPPYEETHITQIQPHRVLDPLLWILWKNKLIPGQPVK